MILEEERDYISIATTRPETMLGDVAVAVHPDPAAALGEGMGDGAANPGACSGDDDDASSQIDQRCVSVWSGSAVSVIGRGQSVTRSTAAHQPSTCTLRSRGSRAAGLKSVPFV